MKNEKNTLLQNEVLDILERLYGAPLTYRQIAARVSKKVGFKNAKDYIPLLQKMATDGLLQQLGRGKFAKPFESKNIIGKIDIKKTGEGYVSSDAFPEDIIVESGLQNKALQGDTVEIAILAKKGKRVKGEVIKVLERNKSKYAGILKVYKDFAFLITDDRKMHKDIFISKTKDFKEEWDGQKALVSITDWPKDAKNPFGKVEKILGKPGVNETEMNAIVTEFGFVTEFPTDVMMAAEKLPDFLNNEEIKQRLDWRKIPTFTIDPESAKDFDDAISIRVIGKDLFELGVHIADVSHYVKAGDLIDKEAFNRATSVYLVDRTIPMLPPKLSENLCSLMPNVDRPAFSAIFHIDSNGKVKKVKFAKTVIHSIMRFSYESAQKVLDTQSGPLLEELNIAHTLGMKLREKRYKEGSMLFESTEFSFQLDNQGKPLGIKVKERGDTHFLIEEFMLLANKHVAMFGHTHFEQSKIPFLFRFHDKPNDLKIDDFKNFASKWGYQIKNQNEAVLKKSINETLIKVAGKAEEGILSQLAIRSMAKATYTPYQTSHFGLGFTHYTHFTSPIRRYPDLLVHRILFEHLQKGKKTFTYSDSRDLEQMCKHSSSMEQKASEAERASVKYKQAEWMSDYVGKDFEAVITGVTDWGIFAEIIENKCEGLIKLSSLKDDMYDLDENAMQLVGRYYFKKHALGDKLIIRVKEANPLARTIDFYMVENLSSGQGKLKNIKPLSKKGGFRPKKK